MTPVSLLELVLVLLGVALVLSALAGRTALPPAAALVLGGMALALTPGTPTLDFNPDLILVLFLPPLLLAAAYFTVWRDFLANLRPILLLSLGAVAFTTGLVGLVAHLVEPSLPWAACFALGAIVSPPDAVAAKAVLERLALPRRIVTILEGESLVNDASGLVLYRFAVAAALTGAFNPAVAAATFVWLAAGGVAVGAAVGLAVTALFRRIRDTHLIIVSSFLAAYVAYIAAERLSASGVLSVVTAGIILGWRQHEVLGANARTQSFAVWDVVTYIMEALVFVLIGLSLRGVLTRMGGDLHGLQTALPLALATTGTVVVARLLWVFPATYLPRLLSRRLRNLDPNPPVAVPLVIGWSGMRGVVSLAIALALPAQLPGRDLLIFASFGVILTTVLVQGTTLAPLIRRLGIGGPRAENLDGSDAAPARARVIQAALNALQAMKGPDGKTLHPQLIEDYARRLRATSRLATEGVGEAGAALHERRRSHFAAALEALSAGRGELIRLHRAKSIHDSTLHDIETELDLEELRLRRLGRN